MQAVSRGSLCSKCRRLRPANKYTRKLGTCDDCLYPITPQPRTPQE